MPAVNDVGEPGAREPHARFDGRELETERLVRVTEVGQPDGKPRASRLLDLPPNHATAPVPDPTQAWVSTPTVGSSGGGRALRSRTLRPGRRQLAEGGPGLHGTVVAVEYRSSGRAHRWHDPRPIAGRLSSCLFFSLQVSDELIGSAVVVDDAHASGTEGVENGDVQLQQRAVPPQAS